MLRTNEKQLVKLSAIGEVTSPLLTRTVYNVSAEGIPSVLPGVGGIAYNMRVGDPACGWQADHAEPCVSVENKENDVRYGKGANAALVVLSCIGNEGTIVTGEAKGSTGVVTGKHGGVDHVLMDFSRETLDKIVIGDKILIKTFGLGLRLLDFPEITVMNVAPGFLKALKLKTNGGRLEIPVTHIAPPVILSSGSGMNQTYAGDYDIQLFDEKARRQYNLDDLRLGDMVAVPDADCSYGSVFRQGAMSVGIVVHANCVSAGHGPGVTMLFTSATGKIIPKIDAKANIARILKLRTDI